MISEKDMEFKNLVKNIFSGFLGSIIFYEILIVIFSMLYVSLFIRTEFYPDVFGIIFIVLGWLTIIVGFILGFKTRAKKNRYYKIFTPNKIKIIMSFLISFFLLIILYLISNKEYPFILTTNFIPVDIAIGFPLAVLFYAVLIYPFGSLCYYLYKFKKKELKLFWLVLLLILLNPIFVILSVSISPLIEFSTLNEPCGVLVDSFTEISPAREAGLQIGEIIIQIDEAKINSIKDLSNYFDKINYPKEIEIITEEKVYQFKLVKDTNKDKYVMGVNLKQEFC